MPAPEISAFISGLQLVDVGALGDEELAERCLAVTKLLDVVHAHAAELTTEFEQRGTWAVDGATSVLAGIAAQSGSPRGELARLAKVGAALRHLPAVANVAKRGEISFDHVQRIRDCTRRGPTFDADDEALLLQHARTLGAEMFRMVARESAVKGRGLAPRRRPAEGPARKEFVHLSQTFDGWYRLDGVSTRLVMRSASNSSSPEIFLGDGLEIAGVVGGGERVLVAAIAATLWRNSPAGGSWVPLNIRCSRKCAMSDWPRGLSAEPTWYQTRWDTTGARCRSDDHLHAVIESELDRVRRPPRGISAAAGSGVGVSALAGSAAIKAPRETRDRRELLHRGNALRR